MQTFLPYSDFKLSAKCLDYKRLGKQRVEAKQILDILINNKINRWRNHPAVLMWKEYKAYLIDYYNIILIEWINRGYNNSMPYIDNIYPKIKPWWLGNELFHASHRSKLLFKNKEYYKQFNWMENDYMPYLWPNNNKMFEIKI